MGVFIPTSIPTPKIEVSQVLDPRKGANTGGDWIAVASLLMPNIPDGENVLRLCCIWINALGNYQLAVLIETCRNVAVGKRKLLSFIRPDLDDLGSVKLRLTMLEADVIGGVAEGLNEKIAMPQDHAFIRALPLHLYS